MNPTIYAVFVVVSTALMGSSFAIGKIELEYMAPLLLVGLRFTAAGLILALLTMRRRHPLGWGGWTRVLIIGLFQTVGVMGCIFLSLRTISANESSILTFSNPLIVVLLGALFLGLRYRPRQWVGVIAGLSGVFVSLGLTVHFHSGTVMGLLGALSWAVATLLVKRWSDVCDVWVLTAYQMLFGGLVLLTLSYFVESPKIIVNLTSLTAFLWLTIMGSIVQFALWYRVLHSGDAAKTSAFLFLAPFFGVLSGWLILHEKINHFVVVGSLLMCAGIILVNWPQRQLKSEGEIQNGNPTDRYHRS